MAYARSVVRIVVLLGIAIPATVVIVGCGGHGPTLPSPDVGGGGGSDLIEVEDFIVAPREVREFDHDTTVRATGIVRIEGAVIGAAGVSLDIRADGEVTVSGVVKAGDGADGPPDEDGGDGGDVRLASVNANITIGVGSNTTEVAIAQGGGTNVSSGNGGSGGDGNLGGQGGEGGLITFDCPNGTLTINQSPGLLHIGNGGHGGEGVVGGDDLLTINPPEELPNGGGNSGAIGGACVELVGVQTQPTGLTPPDGPELVTVLDEGVGTGGVGGDAGDFYFGVDPQTGDSTWPAQVAPSTDASSTEKQDPEKIEGARGGAGPRTGGAGGSMHVDRSGHPTPEGQEGRSLYVVAGRGGPAGLGETVVDHLVGVADSVIGIVTNYHLTAGPGGDATATGYPGGPNGECGRGGKGGLTTGIGGIGGWICGVGFDDQYYHPGKGGWGHAIGGPGGDSGPCCDLPQPGARGGNGGSATAKGGHGGDAGHTAYVGEGGDAWTTGGRGGKGGDGRPPGRGGKGGLSLGRSGGDGSPPGQDRGHIPGPIGETGDPCPDQTGIGGWLTERGVGTIAGHDVGLFRNNQLIAEVQSSGNGHYIFFDVPPGWYSIRPAIPAPGTAWDPVTREVQKQTGSWLKDQDFVLRQTSTDEPGPDDIGGWLTEYEGDVVAGHMVGLFQNDALVAEVQSNSRGRFVFQDVPPGDYELRPARPLGSRVWDPPTRQVRKPAGVAVPNQSFVLDYPPTDDVEDDEITGTLKHEDGTPVTQHYVLLTTAGMFVKEVRSDQNGDYVFDQVPPGTHHVSPAGGGRGRFWDPFDREVNKLSSSRGVSGQDFTLYEGGDRTVTVPLTSVQGALPINVCLELVNSTGGTYEACIDQGGNAVFPFLRPGTLTIGVMFPNAQDNWYWNPAPLVVVLGAQDLTTPPIQGRRTPWGG